MWRRAGARMGQMKCPGCQIQGGTHSQEEPRVVGMGWVIGNGGKWGHSSFYPLVLKPMFSTYWEHTSYNVLDLGYMPKPG